MVWQEAFATASQVELFWHHHGLLFAGLWLVYAGDRWLDARSLHTTIPCTTTRHINPAAQVSQRHLFVKRYQRQFGIIWVAVLVSAVLWAAVALSLAEWTFGLCLAGSSVCYLRLVHQGNKRRWLHKELWVSGIYAAGIGLFVWPHTTFRWPLLISQLLFAGLVFLNLATIARYETQEDSLQRDLSLFDRFPQILDGLGSATIGLVACCAVSALSAPPGVVTLSGHVVFGALLLGLVRAINPLDSSARHGLADIALLTPGLALTAEWLS